MSILSEGSEQPILWNPSATCFLLLGLLHSVFCFSLFLFLGFAFVICLYFNSRKWTYIVSFVKMAQFICQLWSKGSSFTYCFFLLATCFLLLPFCFLCFALCFFFFVLQSCLPFLLKMAQTDVIQTKIKEAKLKRRKSMSHRDSIIYRNFPLTITTVLW